MYLFRALALAGQFTDPARLEGSSGGIQALVVLGLPVLALGVLAWLFWRTRVEIRRRELEPPLSLLTFIHAASHGEAAAAPRQTDQEDLELDRGRRREIAVIRRRGTRLLVALGADAVVLWLAAAWYLREVRSLPSDFSTAQAFTTIEVPRAATPETLTSDLASSPPVPRDPAPAPAHQGPAPSEPSAAREPAPKVSPTRSRTSPPMAERPPVAGGPSNLGAARLDTAMIPSVITADAPAAIPDLPPATLAIPPAPDPARTRADAERALDLAVRHVVRELGARRPVTAVGEGDAAMARLAEWLRSQRPTVAPGALADLEVDGASGEAILPVTLRWRDDFGVGKQRTVRLRVAVQRKADDWVFAGVELLERFP